MIRLQLTAFLLIALFAGTGTLYAQDADALLKEGLTLQQRYKDAEALEKYKLILITNPSHTEAGMRALETTLALALSATNEKDQLFWINQHEIYLNQFSADSADARYQFFNSAYNLQRAKMEKRPDRIADWMKASGWAAQKAMAIAPENGRSQYALGKWHYEMLAFNGFKKAAVRITGGENLPEANLQTAIGLMEQSRKAEPYFAPNFLDLGKAYHLDEKYETAIAVLEQLAKLPARRSTDAAAKAEGAKLLDSLR